MAVSRSSQCLVFWLTICTCVLIGTASPPRRQIVETTSSEPAVTKDAWEETDDFDLDGDEDWLGEVAASPSSIPRLQGYDDDYDDDYAARSGKGHVSDEDDEEVEHQDAEDDEMQPDVGHDAEFLFVPPRDNRLMLEDDEDDQSGPIKVRHTGKNSYSEFMDDDNSVVASKEGKDDSNQFEFTIDNDDDEEEEEVDDEDKEGDDNRKDVLILADPPRKKVNARQPRQEVLLQEDVDDDDFDTDEEVEDDPMFESPEEESQIIYGDHVFLY